MSNMSEEACNCRLWLVGGVALLIPTLYYIRKYFEGGQFTKNVRCDNKVIIITGCNTGIGKETALELAHRGGRIYMACRDTQKCEAARLEIIRESGNPNVFNRKLDLSSLKSVREFVKQFLKEEKYLNILINNAGLMSSELVYTEDGFEQTIGTNHLGHFLLTMLLLDTLKSSRPSRIVNVSSDGHKMGKINKNDLHYRNRPFSSWSSYFQSKLANVLFTRELAKRLKGTGVTTNSLHPGAVKTDFQRNIPKWLLIIGHAFVLFVKSVKSGAQTNIAAAIDPDFESVTGRYLSDCKIGKESKLAQDDEMAEWLWATSEKLTGLKD